MQRGLPSLVKASVVDESLRTYIIEKFVTHGEGGVRQCHLLCLSILFFDPPRSLRRRLVWCIGGSERFAWCDVGGAPACSRSREEGLSKQSTARKLCGLGGYHGCAEYRCCREDSQGVVCRWGDAGYWWGQKKVLGDAWSRGRGADMVRLMIVSAVPAHTGK